MTPKTIRTEFDDFEHLTVREAAARHGLPIKHFAQRAILDEARRALSVPRPAAPTVTPATSTPSETGTTDAKGEAS